MRIISGKYKGRILEGFTLDKTRPTMDRVKESLFAMIQDKIVDSTVLDLFAGSGNLGFEALSQGANKVYFVDNNNKAINVINDNNTKLGNLNIEIIKGDYLKALKELETEFDIIFLDPPYNTDYINKSIDKIIEYRLLKDEGIIVCETDDLKKIIIPNDFNVSKQKRYGNKYVVMIKKI